MSVNILKRKQTLPITLQEAWDFFSSPKNLVRITPPDMQFKITSGNENDKMYEGMIITYKVKPLMKIGVTWVTEITKVEEPHFFIDMQRNGPYKLWHHKHYFREVEGGVEVADEVHYMLPFGILGKIVHKVIVQQRVEYIYKYRELKLQEIFGKKIDFNI